MSKSWTFLLNKTDVVINHDSFGSWEGKTREYAHLVSPHNGYIYAFDHDNISYKKGFLAALAIMRNVYINVFLDAYRDWLFSNGFLYQYLAYILETTTLRLIQ